MPLLLAEFSILGLPLDGVIVGVVTFVFSRAVWDWCEIRTKTKRLKNAVVMEAVATVRKLKDNLQHIKSLKLTENRFECLRAMPSGLIYAAPLPELGQLLTLIPNDEAHDLFRLLDRWSRLVALTKHYETVFNKAVDAAAKCDGKTPILSEACDEYMGQAIGTLNLIYSVGNEACEFACRLFQRYGPYQDCEVQEISLQQWKSRPECNSDREGFCTNSKQKQLLPLPTATQKSGADDFQSQDHENG